MKAVKVYVKATGVVGVNNHYAEDSFVTNINVRIGADFFEYRVFAYDLYSEGEMPNNLNY